MLETEAAAIKQVARAVDIRTFGLIDSPGARFFSGLYSSRNRLSQGLITAGLITAAAPGRESIGRNQQEHRAVRRSPPPRRAAARAPAAALPPGRPASRS